MREVVLPVIGTVAAWRAEARVLLAEGVRAEDVLWRVGQETGDLFATTTRDAARTPAGAGAGAAPRLSRIALDTIDRALCHSDPERFARAYGVVRRLARREVRWGDRSDPAMGRLLAQAKAVARDVHKMHAFVRFRELEGAEGRRRFAAWFEPEHPIEEAAAPFFARRFGDMDWAIATPRVTARFVAGRLAFEVADGAPPPPEDATEELWRTYYRSIFNPARLMVKAMQSEMPRKYWQNLPEARLIPELVRTAPARAEAMRAALPTEPPVRRLAAARAMAAPDQRAGPASGTPESLGAIAHALSACRRCPLYRDATQAVPGEGPPDADLMIVGEQPGDSEDLAGRPFVGPAGELFDAEAAAAGIDRSRAFVTNAVKHFKFTPRGKRRLHQRPDAGEVEACRWWLDLERRLVRPKLILALGATAAAALTGSGAGILKRRGGIEPGPEGVPVFLTVHPSYLLRLPDAGLREVERARFRADLRAAAGELARLAA